MLAEDGVPVRGNSAPLGWLTKDAILKGPYWPEAISVVSHFQSSQGFVTVEAVGLHTLQHYTTTLPSSAWETLRPDRTERTFNAPAQPFRLALKAERLRLAYAADPLLAANNARYICCPTRSKRCMATWWPAPLGPDSTFQDVCIFASKKEQESYQLYRDLAAQSTGEVRDLLEAMAKDELRHKNLVERWYEDVVYQEF
jgi:hypothetical protein